MTAINGDGGGLTKIKCPFIFLLPICYFADPSYVSKLSSQPMVSRKRRFLSFKMFRITIYYSSAMYSSYFNFQMTMENNYAIAIARPRASFSANQEKKPKPIALCTYHFFSALGK